MKKILLIGIVMTFIASSFVFGQTYSVTDHHHNPVSDGDTVVVFANTAEIADHHVYVTNISGSSVDFAITREELSVVSGIMETFCIFQQCFSTDKTITGSLPPNGYDSLHVTYYCFGNYGKSFISYYIRNKAETDSMKVVFQYRCFVGIDENSNIDLDFSNAYPNPAAASASIDYEINDDFDNASVVLYEITGKKVLEEKIYDRNGTVRLNTSNISGGLYLYSIIVDGETVLTKKLAVRE